jgi:hypothetical protein
MPIPLIALTRTIRRWLRAWRTLEPMDVITGPVSYRLCGRCGAYHPERKG